VKRVFVSYRADSEELRARVLELAHELRGAGVDAVLDAFVADPSDAWVREAIGSADLVIAVCTERYRRAFDAGGDGIGWERALIDGIARQEPERVIPLLLEDGAAHFVPRALRSVQAVYLPEQLPALLRRLGATGAPAPRIEPVPSATTALPDADTVVIDVALDPAWRAPAGELAEQVEAGTDGAVAAPATRPRAGRERAADGPGAARGSGASAGALATPPEPGPSGDGLASGAARRDGSAPGTTTVAALAQAAGGRRAAQRRVANIPLLGSADFVGRTFELSAIRTALAAPARGGVAEPVIMYGAAGIGKTALALQHAYRQQDSYDVLWLVRAQTESTVRLDLARLARELGLLAGAALDDEAEVSAARAWLAAHDRWLVVFDEAPGPDVIAAYVPRPLRGHVIVTSRGPDWREAGHKVEVGALAREDSIDLLLRASGRADPVGADQLASWLEGHPLMVRLAGALARDRGVALDVLLRQLRADRGRAAGLAPRATPRLETLLAIAVQDARQRSPAIGALVELIAYLAPHDIPIRLLREHVEHLPAELAAAARDDNALARLLDDAARLGLITRDDSELAVHGTVQAAVRGTTQSGAAVRLLDAAFAWDVDAPETWPAAEALLPHALAAVEDPYAPAAQPEALQRLLARVAACTWKRGEPARALGYQRRAIALLEKSAAAPGREPGPVRRAQLARALATLGSMLREAGDLTEAMAQLQRARELLGDLAAGGRAPAPAAGAPADGAAPAGRGSAPVIAAAGARGAPGGLPAAPPGAYPSAIGDVLRARLGSRAPRRAGSESDAQRGSDPALPLLPRTSTADLLDAAVHADTIAVLRELARVHVARGEHVAARGYLTHALELDRARLGADDDLSIAMTLVELSGAELAAGRVDGAATALDRALAMQRRILATDEHPLVAATLQRSAAICALRGDLPEARVRLERALETLRRVYRTDHHVAITAVMNELADVLVRVGDLVGARRLLEQALESQARLFGAAGSPITATVSYHLAKVLVAQGDAVGARRELERALSRLAAHGSGGHPVAAAVLELLAQLDARTDLAAARKRYEQALQVRMESADRGSREVLATAAALADVLAKLGERSAAEAMMAEIQVHVRAGRLPVDAASAPALLAVAEALRHLGQLAQARELAAGAVAALEIDPARDDAALARGQLALARIALAQGQIAEARAAAGVAHALATRALGPRSREAGTVALLRAEIALHGGEPTTALALAGAARRSLGRGAEDEGSLAAIARALEVAGLAARALGRPATAARLFLRALERGDRPVAREALAELVEELAAVRPGWDPRPAVARLVELQPGWLADRVFATAALADARITSELRVRLELAGAAIGAALGLGAADGAAAPGAAEPPSGSSPPPEAIAGSGPIAEPAPSEPAPAAGAPQGQPPMGATPPRVRGPAPAAPRARSATGAPGGPASPASAPASYGWRVELAPIRAGGATSEVRTLPIEARYAGPGKLEIIASTDNLPWGTYLLTVRFFDSPRDVWRADVAVSNEESGNPFLAGPPVRGDRFFGRTRLLDEIRQLIENASIVLLGPRRSGKTSVLYRLAQLCAPTWAVCLVDLHTHSGAHDDHELMRELAEQVARAAGADAPELALALAEERPLLALQRALKAGRTRRVLLLLDEMAILAHYPDAALQLRAMSKWSDPLVRVVTAGTPRDLDRITTSTVRGSSALNEFLNRELDALTHQEAVSLLERPVLGRYRYEPGALDAILALGAGRPFFLNAIAHLALEAVRQEGGRVVTEAHVEAARRDASSALGRWYRELLGELDEHTRGALPAMVAQGGAVPTEHADALRSAGIAVGPRRATALDPIFADWWNRGGPR
jgi:tetratricopeptide (TPR) repeat protein